MVADRGATSATTRLTTTTTTTAAATPPAPGPPRARHHDGEGRGDDPHDDGEHERGVQAAAAVLEDPHEVRRARARRRRSRVRGRDRGAAARSRQPRGRRPRPAARRSRPARPGRRGHDVRPWLGTIRPRPRGRRRAAARSGRTSRRSSTGSAWSIPSRCSSPCTVSSWSSSCSERRDAGAWRAQPPPGTARRPRGSPAGPAGSRRARRSGTPARRWARPCPCAAGSAPRWCPRRPGGCDTSMSRGPGGPQDVAGQRRPGRRCRRLTRLLVGQEDGHLSASPARRRRHVRPRVPPRGARTPRRCAGRWRGARRRLASSVAKATPSMPVQDVAHDPQPRARAAGQVDLGDVAGHHGLGPEPDAGQEHLHLLGRGVLRLVEHDERVVERAAAHVGQRGDLDRAAVDVAR